MIGKTILYYKILEKLGEDGPVPRSHSSNFGDNI
jgi:hypothetical protein